MTNTENIQKPTITDLWLVVDEEQTLRFGMRQAWRWAVVQQQVQRPTREHERLQARCGV